MDVSYRLSTERGEDNIVYRKVEDADGVECEMWYPAKKKWDYHPDAYGAFSGFNSSKKIAEEEAKKILPPEAF